MLYNQYPYLFRFSTKDPKCLDFVLLEACSTARLTFNLEDNMLHQEISLKNKYTKPVGYRTTQHMRLKKNKSSRFGKANY